MKKLLILLVMMTASAFALERKDLMLFIEEAADKRGTAYVEVRNKIVEYDTTLLLLLAELAVDETLSWQQRLIARICYERIARKEDIKNLLATDWYSHPDFNPEWNMLITGPEGSMPKIIEPELKKIGLWYYYLEREWKMTDENGNIRKGNFPDTWMNCCTFAVKGSSEERIWFFRIFSEIMANPDTYLSRVERLPKFLMWEGKPDSAYVLEHRAPPPITSEPPFRLGTNIIKRAKQP